MDLQEQLQTALSGRYALDHELGRGGMAVVYLARDLKHARPVALKVLRPELATVLGPERFLREIEIAANLHHPHILPLYDSGEAGGFLYYAMPFVEGESLRNRLRRERQLPLDDALQITQEVADALSYAHSLGVIHRDIKPENILFEAGHAVVADFGIARAVSAAGAEQLTETGLAVGTPAYMSPEQASGERELDGRTDVYALGCVLYEMLGGETPYTGPSAQAILAKKLSEPLPHVSVVRESVPAAVEATLGKALARHPADRFVTAGQFAEVLRAPQAHLTIEPTERGAKRRRLAVAAAWVAAAMLAVAAGLYFGLNQSAHAAESTMLAVLPFENLGAAEDEYFADGVTQEINSRLAHIGGLALIGRTSVMQYKNTEKPVAQIGSELGVEYLLTGTIRWEKLGEGESRVRIAPELVRVTDGRQLWTTQYDAPLTSVFGVQGDIAGRVAEALEVTLRGVELEALRAAPTDNLQAYDYYLLGRHYLGLWEPGSVEEAIEYFQRAVAADSTYAQGYAGLAYAHAILGAFGVLYPDDAWPPVRAAAEKALALDSQLAEAHTALALEAASYRHAWSTADERLRLAAEINPSSVDALVVHGLLLGGIFGETSEAVVLYERAMRLDPQSRDVRVNLPVILAWAGRIDEAMAAAQRLVTEDPGYAVGHEALAEILLTQGSYEEALVAMETADAMGYHPDLGKGVLGYIYGRVGQVDNALAQLERLDRRAARGQYVSPVARAWVYAGLGDVDAVLNSLEEAFQERSHFLMWLGTEPFAWPNLASEQRVWALLRRLDYPRWRSHGP
jgi:serine/threonine-protein kinase